MSIYATLWHLRFPRHGDAYVGCEWVDVFAAMPFQLLHDRLCTALCGTTPRLVMEVFGPDSTTALVFEDGSKAPGPPITK